MMTSAGVAARRLRRLAARSALASNNAARETTFASVPQNPGAVVLEHDTDLGAGFECLRTGPAVLLAHDEVVTAIKLHVIVVSCAEIDDVRKVPATVPLDASAIRSACSGRTTTVHRIGGIEVFREPCRHDRVGSELTVATPDFFDTTVP